MASKRTGRGTVLFGLLVLLAGVGGAVVLYLMSQQRGDDAIRDLARAPVGCDTTLSFSDTGTFYVYVEHLGTLEALDGDCETPEEYSRDGDDEPTVQITVTDGSGAEIELDRLEDEFTYSLDDSFAGTAKRRFEIESTGDYVVRVDSEDDDFVIAVGRDPADEASTMRLGAVAAGIAGIVLGLGLVLLGVRRGRRARRIATAYTAAPGTLVGAPAPTAPPMMQPPQPMPAPQQPADWLPGHALGPPIVTPGQQPPVGQHAPAGQAPSPFAPPRVFAPPGMPIAPGPPPAQSPIAPPTPAAPADPAWRDPNTDDTPDGDGRDDLRGDASR